MKLKILVLFALISLSISGCIIQGKRVNVNSSFDVFSVSQIYVRGEILYSINYIDKNGQIITLLQDANVHIYVLNTSEESKLIFDSYVDYGAYKERYYTLYLNKKQFIGVDVDQSTIL